MQYDARSQRLVSFPPGISAEGVSFSNDGTWMAYVKFPQGELWRSKVDGSEQLQLTYRPRVAYDPHWSSDGKRIVFCAQQPGTGWQLYVVSAEGGLPERLLPSRTNIGDPSWSPDGNSVLFARMEESNEKSLYILDLRTSRVSTVPGSDGLYSPRWSPDGRYIAATTPEGLKLMLFDFTTQKWVSLLDFTNSKSLFLAKMSVGWQSWSRDEKHIYFDSYFGAEQGIFRVGISDHKLEKVVSLKETRQTGTFGAWFSLTPDGTPLVLRDVGTQEIYALDWEAP
jgi:Tol biopolymer transport system component